MVIVGRSVCGEEGLQERSCRRRSRQRGLPAYSRAALVKHHSLPQALRRASKLWKVGARNSASTSSKPRSEQAEVVRPLWPSWLAGLLRYSFSRKSSAVALVAKREQLYSYWQCSAPWLPVRPAPPPPPFGIRKQQDCSSRSSRVAAQLPAVATGAAAD